MSQSINLGNVGATTFNGATVDKINLNGSLIWTGSSSYVVGIYASIAPDSKTNAGVSEWGFMKFATLEGYPTGMGIIGGNIGGGTLSPNTYKGQDVALISWCRFDTGAYVGYGTLSIRIQGLHPRNYFTSLKVGSQTFYTSQTGGGRTAEYVGSGLFLDNEGITSIMAGAAAGHLEWPKDLGYTHWEWRTTDTNNPMGTSGNQTVVIA
jgi:hypothetical protein